MKNPTNLMYNVQGTKYNSKLRSSIVQLFNCSIVLLFFNCLLLLPPASSFAQPGTLDPTFSTDRILTTAIGSNSDYGRSVAIQSDGKIVDKSGPVQIVADNKWISMIN